MAPLRLALGALAVCAGCALVVDTNGLTGGAEPADAAAEAAPDVAAPPHPMISCGLAQCDPSSTFCCVDPGGHCSAPTSCRPTSERSGCSGNCGYPLSCDDTADCADAGPGLICCAALNSGNGPIGLSCLSLLDCKKQGQHRVACDPTVAVPCPEMAACAFEDGGLSVPTCNGL
jgi:hypothetical protein